MFKCSSVVLKVASRCNLNCSYCYMYNLGDSTYKNQPKVMSDEVVEAILHKTKKHCDETGIKEFVFIFHGGEPLLCGRDFFQKFVDKAYEILLPSVFPFFTVQTNGVLIDKEWADFLEENNIQACCSIDGYKEVNDQFRVYHNNKGSFDDILKGISFLREKNPEERLNVLSVTNIEADPRKLLQFFSDNKFDFDLLLMDANYDKLPPGKSSFADTSYGTWLCEVFDLWYDEYQEVTIRMFMNIIFMLLGRNNSTDAYGKGENGVLVIETDGSIEAVDVLKICGDGFTKNDLNITRNDFSEALQVDLIDQYVNANNELPESCANCSLGEVCAGGYLPHRYSEKNGFDNPSIYCHDLAKLIIHIRNRLVGEIQDEGQAEFVKFEDFLAEVNT